MTGDGRLVACVLAAVLAGCAGVADPERKMFYIEVEKPAVRVTSPPTAPVLSVAFVGVAPQFAGQAFVYRTGEDRWEKDFYNGFVVSTPEMLTQLVRQWMADTGMYSSVVTPGSGGAANFVLECHVSELYGDFRDPAAPAAVVTIEAEIWTGFPYERRRVAGWTVSGRAALPDRSPKGLVRAWNEATRTALAQLQRNIAGIGR